MATRRLTVFLNSGHSFYIDGDEAALKRIITLYIQMKTSNPNVSQVIYSDGYAVSVMSISAMIIGTKIETYKTNDDDDDDSEDKLRRPWKKM